MKVLAKVKMPKTSQRDFLVAHRYTICDGMCALRGVLQTAVACRRQSKGNTAFFPSVQRAHLPICILCVQ